MVATRELAQEAFSNDGNNNNNNRDNNSRASTKKSSPSSSAASKKPSITSSSPSDSRASVAGKESSGIQVGTNQHLADSNANSQAGAQSHSSSSKTAIATNSPARESSIQVMSANQQISADKETRKTSAKTTKGTKEKVDKKSKKQKNKKGATKGPGDGNVHDDGNDTKDINAVNRRHDSNKFPALVAGVEPKQKSHVDELKLFQNNQLLNQQDPIQQLHIQLSQLTEDDANNDRDVANNAVRQSMPHNSDNLQASSRLQTTTNNHQSQQYQQQQQIIADGGQPPGYNQHQFVATQQYVNEENISTVKKGVLWQQQQYDKFHQRLFSRWKKRYFILTTDYLVCFKRSTSKVGRSEMGKFLYKTALGDVTKIGRLKPKKSDKGAIILHVNGEFNLFLWSKENLDEWMFMISESIERNRLRRTCQIACQDRNRNQNSKQNDSTTQAPSGQSRKLQDEIQAADKVDDFYENTTNIARDEQVTSKPNHQLGSEIDASIKRKNSTNNSDGNNDDIMSLSLNDREIRSQTITRHSKDEVLHLKLEPTKRGSQEQQQHHQSKTSEIDRKHPDEDGSLGSSPGSVASSAGTTLSGSDKAKKSTECEHRRGDCADLEKIAQRDCDETNSNAIDNVQASGRVDDGTKVIYDPTSNDGSRRRTSNIGATKLGNQSEQLGGYTDGSLKILRTKERGVNRSSFERQELKNQLSKESSSSSSSERVLASKSSKSSKQSVETPRADGDSFEQIDKPNDWKRSVDNQRNGMINSVNPFPQATATTTTDSDKDEFNKERIDKKCNSHPPRDGHSPGGEQLAVCDSLSESITTATTNTTNSFQVKTTTNLPGSMANRPLPTPTTNLIRRDNSWQSLVSLTCAGKVTPVAMQVAQRSLYAQHIMPEPDKADLTRFRQQEYTKSPVGSRQQQHIINIESTITPSRGPFLRQQSMQSSIQGDRFRPLPPIGGANSTNEHQQQHAASFDLAASTNSPMHPNQSSNNNRTTSYQQKLLQLQLLHNSNNVDYIRHNNNNNGDLSNDYQIYGPESTNGYGYGYGYSSMRSNLKSAASEFSFIRPSFSSQAQSTLPHPHHNQASQNAPPAGSASFVLDNQGTRHPANQPMRSSLILASNSPNTAAGQEVSNFNQTSYIQQQQSDSNNNDISSNCMSPMAKQFRVNPVAGERIINQQQQQQLRYQLRPNGQGSEYKEQRHQLMGVAQGDPMMAPMRELPLKPNKKRVLNDDGPSAPDNNLPKSSSLTSSIACFFRRAFSRRSKKNTSKRRSKLAESCSSSLGAFEDGYPNAPMIASAFSTGSKSVGDVGRGSNSNHNKQSPRMIDMIEAFTNKTHANETSDTLLSTRLAPVNKDAASGLQRQYSSNLLKATNFNSRLGNGELGTPKLVVSQKTRNTLNQFGSPLHKSNSISATMGLSFVHDQTNGSNNLNNNASSFLYDNAMMAASGGSPMLMRSNKVMSANLTSLALQQQQQQHNEFGLDHQSFLSPRNSNRRSEHLPRPSSIYGQPSMISSPIISDRGGDNFGAHRNSLHNHHHFRDRSQPPGSGGFEVRQRHNHQHHHQIMKGPFLDTTREVAEELSSPVAESSKLLDYENAKDSNPIMNSTLSTSHHGQMVEQSPSVHGGRYFISASPSSSKLHHRQAVVNPTTLQSPTMGTIYDNHPIFEASCGGNQELPTSSSSYSHYDNHSHLLMGRQQQQGKNQQPASPSLHQHHQQMKMSGSTSSSSRGLHMNNFEDPYSQRINAHSTINQSQTPSHHRLSSSSDLSGSIAQSMRSNEHGIKPSAIVTPAGQNLNLQASSRNYIRNDLCPSGGSISGSPISDHHYRSDKGNLKQPGLEPQSRSPMLSRRAGNQNHYQQSPLVSLQTRVLNKGDGVQATVSMIRPDIDSGRSMVGGQAVVNIAGAPGINLEPSLAASLLRGTNINAYECSTFDRLTSGQSRQNSKTFLVSTRLSKSMACSNGTSNENGSDTSIIRDESSVSNSTACMRTSRDELSSSGSRSMNSSIGGRSGSSRMRSSNLGTSSSHEDQEQDESSGSDVKADKSVIMANNNIQQRGTSNNNNNHRASRRKKKESSSGEINSQSNSLEKPDERNWITSKLVD